MQKRGFFITDNSTLERIRWVNKKLYHSFIGLATRLFIGRLSLPEIKNIEKKLGIALPDSFIWFLSEYGMGGIHGVEIYGGGAGQIPSCVRETLSLRNEGLPESLVVVESCDEWLYCLDTSRMINGECPIVDWAKGEGVGKQIYSNFYDYLERRLSESLNCMVATSFSV